MIHFPPVSYPPDVPNEVKWFLRCLILYGAKTVSVDIDGQRVKAVRFTFPGGQERTVDCSDRPARPALIVGRGRV